MRCWPPVEEWKKFREYLARDEMPVAQFFNRAIHEYVVECDKYYAAMNEKDPPLAVE